MHYREQERVKREQRVNPLYVRTNDADFVEEISNPLMPPILWGADIRTERRRRGLEKGRKELNNCSDTHPANPYRIDKGALIA